MGIKDLLSIVSALLGTRERIILGIVGGFLIGWLIFGWLLFPVTWTDAAPPDLQLNYRQNYLNMVAYIHEVDPSIDVAPLLDSWSEDQLGRDLNQIYASAADAGTKGRMASLGMVMGIGVTGEVAAEEGGRSIGGIVAVFFIVLIGVSSIFVLWRLRQQGAGAPADIGGDLKKVAAARTQWTEDEAPMAQFVTSYALGDDYYDQSFSIETPLGEFLGECGVGISEAIGIDEPKKVTAFEVWLFDKNDIRTVTKVLMTEHCYYDDALRTKLAPKGEAVLGEEGAVIDLSTASLRVDAKVIEMEYGEGNLPPNSFVTRLTMELAAWQLEVPSAQADTLAAAI